MAAIAGSQSIWYKTMCTQRRVPASDGGSDVARDGPSGIGDDGTTTVGDVGMGFTNVWDDPAVVAACPVMVADDVFAGDGNNRTVVVVANAIGSAACP